MEELRQQEEDVRELKSAIAEGNKDKVNLMRETTLLHDKYVEQ